MLTTNNKLSFLKDDLVKIITNYADLLGAFEL